MDNLGASSVAWCGVSWHGVAPQDFAWLVPAVARASLATRVHVARHGMAWPGVTEHSTSAGQDAQDRASEKRTGQDWTALDNRG